MNRLSLWLVWKGEGGRMELVGPWELRGGLLCSEPGVGLRAGVSVLPETEGSPGMGMLRRHPCPERSHRRR